MKPFLKLLVSVQLLTMVPATALGLAEIHYPVYLAYDQGDQKIDIRGLPFATRFAHPEFIGSALSAPYLVPHNDSADLPKNINLINVCGIRVSTTDRGTSEAGKPTLALEIDLRDLKRPEHVPFELEEVVEAAAKAIQATLARHGCVIKERVIRSSAGQETLKALLESRLQPETPAP